MKPNLQFCHGEMEEFPPDEFEYDKEGTLIHKRGKDHYASTGEYVKRSSTPGTADVEFPLNNQED